MYTLVQPLSRSPLLHDAGVRPRSSGFILLSWLIIPTRPITVTTIIITIIATNIVTVSRVFELLTSLCVDCQGARGLPRAKLSAGLSSRGSARGFSKRSA